MDAGMGCTLQPAGAALRGTLGAGHQCGLPPFRRLPAIILPGHHPQGGVPLPLPVAPPPP